MQSGAFIGCMGGGALQVTINVPLTDRTRCACLEMLEIRRCGWPEHAGGADGIGHDENQWEIPLLCCHAMFSRPSFKPGLLYYAFQRGMCSPPAAEAQGHVQRRDHRQDEERGLPREQRSRYAPPSGLLEISEIRMMASMTRGEDGLQLGA